MGGGAASAQLDLQDLMAHQNRRARDSVCEKGAGPTCVDSAFVQPLSVMLECLPLTIDTQIEQAGL